jgi:hypothetical protein
MTLKEKKIFDVILKRFTAKQKLNIIFLFIYPSNKKKIHGFTKCLDNFYRFILISWNEDVFFLLLPIFPNNITLPISKKMPAVRSSSIV